MNGSIPLIKDFREHLIPSTGKQELSRTRTCLCLDKQISCRFLLNRGSQPFEFPLVSSASQPHPLSMNTLFNL